LWRDLEPASLSATAAAINCHSLTELAFVSPALVDFDVHGGCGTDTLSWSNRKRPSRPLCQAANVASVQA